MTYIDKRALATKKSPTSLIPYVSLDNIVKKIIAEQPATTVTAGDFLNVADGVIEFSGGTTDKIKQITTASTKDDISSNTVRNWGATASDLTSFTINDDIAGYYTATSEYEFGASKALFTLNRYDTGIVDRTNEIEITPTVFRVSSLSSSTPNVLSVNSTGVFGISDYPIARQVYQNGYLPATVIGTGLTLFSPLSGGSFVANTQALSESYLPSSTILNMKVNVVSNSAEASTAIVILVGGSVVATITIGAEETGLFTAEDINYTYSNSNPICLRLTTTLAAGSISLSGVVVTMAAL